MPLSACSSRRPPQGNRILYRFPRWSCSTTLQLDAIALLIAPCGLLSYNKMVIHKAYAVEHKEQSLWNDKHESV